MLFWRARDPARTCIIQQDMQRSIIAQQSARTNPHKPAAVCGVHCIQLEAGDDGRTAPTYLAGKGPASTIGGVTSCIVSCGCACDACGQGSVATSSADATRARLVMSTTSSSPARDVCCDDCGTLDMLVRADASVPRRLVHLPTIRTQLNFLELRDEFVMFGAERVVDLARSAYMAERCCWYRKPSCGAVLQAASSFKYQVKTSMGLVVLFQG
jgi:hypothetical protein